MNPAAPLISRRDGKSRTLRLAQVCQIDLGVTKANGWKFCFQAKVVDNAIQAASGILWGAPGVLHQKIQNAFFDIVNGRNSIYAHGLTRV